MSTAENDIRLPSFFDRDPELKARFMEAIKKLPPGDKKKNIQLVHKFIEGEMTWAEVNSVPKRLLKELARIAYYKFQAGDLKKAEILFKGLAIMDHLNWYFRAALGAIYQKQGQFEMAVNEYDMALELKPDDVSCLVNRGQCLLKLKEFDEALIDFNDVLKMQLDEKSPWLKRAKTLSQAILSMKGK